MQPTSALQWVAEHPDLAIAIFGLLTGAGETLRRYRRTGKLPLRTFPWKAIRRLIYEGRRTFFRTNKPADHRLSHVGAPLDVVENHLAMSGYEPDWPLSYHYRGEDANLRRYYYDSTREFPHRQVHARLWNRPDGVDLYAHEEPSAVHHPRAHLRSRDMTDWTAWVTEQIGAGLEGDLDPGRRDGR